LLDELAAEDAGPGEGSNLGLAAASGGDVGAQLSKNPLATYLAVLADLSQAQIVLAFSRAAMECKHFPVPALLRDFASIGEPVAMEANESSDGSYATMWLLGRGGDAANDNTKVP